MRDETKVRLTIIFLIATILVISFSVAYFMVIKPTNFCESKGYNYYHTNTEKGYIACCRNVLENHIKTDETVCEAFKKDKG